VVVVGRVTTITAITAIIEEVNVNPTPTSMKQKLPFEHEEDVEVVVLLDTFATRWFRGDER